MHYYTYLHQNKNKLLLFFYHFFSLVDIHLMCSYPFQRLEQVHQLKNIDDLILDEMRMYVWRINHADYYFQLIVYWLNQLISNIYHYILLLYVVWNRIVLDNLYLHQYSYLFNRINVDLPSRNTPDSFDDWLVTSHLQQCNGESRDLIWWKIMKR
jgi:hypothetical protein